MSQRRRRRTKIVDLFEEEDNKVESKRKIVGKLKRYPDLTQDEVDKLMGG